MTVFRAQTAFEPTSDLPEDVCMNTMHFEGTDTDYQNIADLVEDFYTSVDGAGDALTNTLMTSKALTGSCTTKVYRLEDTKPRIPVLEYDWEFQQSSSSGMLPTECSVCLSFEGAAVSGVRQQSRRNRIYIPGLRSAIVGDDGLVNNVYTQVLRDAAQRLLDAAEASVSKDWVVYSPKLAAAGSGPSDGTSLVVGGWVDNAFDTQRRRGTAPTGRREFSSGA